MQDGTKLVNDKFKVEQQKVNSDSETRISDLIRCLHDGLVSCQCRDHGPARTRLPHELSERGKQLSDPHWYKRWGNMRKMENEGKNENEENGENKKFALDLRRNHDLEFLHVSTYHVYCRVLSRDQKHYHRRDALLLVNPNGHQNPLCQNLTLTLAIWENLRQSNSAED